MHAQTRCRHREPWNSLHLVYPCKKPSLVRIHVSKKMTENKCAQESPGVVLAARSFRRSSSSFGIRCLVNRLFSCEYPLNLRLIPDAKRTQECHLICRRGCSLAGRRTLESRCAN